MWSVRYAGRADPFQSLSEFLYLSGFLQRAASQRGRWHDADPTAGEKQFRRGIDLLSGNSSCMNRHVCSDPLADDPAPSAILRRGSHPASSNFKEDVGHGASNQAVVGIEQQGLVGTLILSATKRCDVRPVIPSFQIFEFTSTCAGVQNNAVGIWENAFAAFANKCDSAIGCGRLRRAVACCDVYPRKGGPRDRPEYASNVLQAVQGKLKLLAACGIAYRSKVFW